MEGQAAMEFWYQRAEERKGLGQLSCAVTNEAERRALSGRRTG